MSSHAMSKSLQRIAELADRDGRFKFDAYLFVHQTLAYVELQRGERRRRGGASPNRSAASTVQHLTGQELCEAIRQYAQELYGMMAYLVLRNWGVRSTGDFGDIVYQLIDIGEMTKSETDQRCDFDAVYDFELALRHEYTFSAADDS